jgi:murein DD-endopeptidase MepM/ murein hydrolase activator NlpD
MINAIPINGVAAAARAPAAQRAKVTELAEQFESLLLTQMLRQMRQSMLTDESDDDHAGLGSKSMTDMIDAKLAESLSRSSRLGLADFIVRAFDRQAQGQATPAAASKSPAVSLATVAAPALGASQPGGDPASAGTASAAGADPAAAVPSGPVSSAFGWRSDPITGLPRFHSGTDVKMAYGQDVRAATGGRVAFVGNQGGYGLTVVVDHGDGVETRYAHLSSAPLHQGEQVESGQVIAQSGNSGRSTGPHLHFEVLNNGHAMDPRSPTGALVTKVVGTD